MKAVFLRNYRKANTGNVVFVYKVTGNKEELAKYKTAQGEYYTEDAKDGILWFSPQFVGQSVELLITSKGKVVADMSKFDMAQSLVNQYQGALGAEIAKQAVSMLLGSEFGATQSVPASETPQIGAPQESEDLDNL